MFYILNNMDHNEIIFTYNFINTIHGFIFYINDNNLYCKFCIVDY